MMAHRDLSEISVQLNPEQFAFLQARHEVVEHACIAVKLGDTTAVDNLVNSLDYQRLFGIMSWDDVYDRYQDTPGYDDTLTKALHQQLVSDLLSGKVRRPDAQTGFQADFTADELVEMGLHRLDE